MRLVTAVEFIQQCVHHGKIVSQLVHVIQQQISTMGTVKVYRQSCTVCQIEQYYDFVATDGGRLFGMAVDTPIRQKAG